MSIELRNKVDQLERKVESLTALVNRLEPLVDAMWKNLIGEQPLPESLTSRKTLTLEKRKSA